MNPFDLAGPPFLGFYAAVCVILWAASSRLQSWLERGDKPFPKLADPYEIGYLRDGPRGAVDVAITTLFQRQFIAQSGPVIHSMERAPGRSGLNLLETEILDFLPIDLSVPHRIRDLRFHAVSDRLFAHKLQRVGLVASEKQQRARLTILALAFLIGLTLAAVKIVIALQRGRTNVSFLILECVGFGYLMFHTPSVARTSLGTNALRALQGMVHHARRRLQLNSDEVILLTAVFGSHVMPNTWQRLWSAIRNPNVVPSRGGGRFGGCSGGSGGCGGGGCGGGGCGGGCGGCGS